MKTGTIIGIVAAVIVVGGGAYLVRGLEPSQAAVEEGNAFTAADKAMMAEMSGPKMVFTGNADADFARMMIPHHQGAIDMAAVELKYGSNPHLRKLAQTIQAAQKPEIDQMTAWRKANAAPAPLPPADAKAEQAANMAANDKMMNGMMGDSMAHSGNADLDFVNMMIPHHQGAIDMANIELKYGTDPALRTLSQAIVTAQQSEIAEMNAWLKANGH